MSSINCSLNRNRKLTHQNINIVVVIKDILTLDVVVIKDILTTVPLFTE